MTRSAPRCAHDLRDRRTAVWAAAVGCGLLTAGCGPLDALPAHGTAAAPTPLTEAAASDHLAAAWRSRYGREPEMTRIRDEVRLAFEARRRFPWGAEIPDPLFLDDVLPPVQLDEEVEAWRSGLLDRFATLVGSARTAGEAAVALNEGIWGPLGVGYSAQPPRRPMVNPSQACALGKVNCTGLAILLADACRALAIPARVAGIPAWSTSPDDPQAVRGYHQWVEVWDGSWRFLSAIDRSELDAAWFAPRAARTDVGDPLHRIYAARFAPGGAWFPLPWKPQRHLVPGIDVTPFYTRRLEVRIEIPEHRRVELRWNGGLVAAGSGPGFAAALAGGESYEWRLLDAERRLLEAGVITPHEDESRLVLPPIRAGGPQAGHSAIR